MATSGTGAPSGYYFPYTRAGKTGTTENGWDVWYCGYTPQLAAAVWMGNADRNSPMDGAYGGTYCAPMWAKFFASCAQGQQPPRLRHRAVDLRPVARQDAGRFAVAVALAEPRRPRRPRPSSRP